MSTMRSRSGWTSLLQGRQAIVGLLFFASTLSSAHMDPFDTRAAIDMTPPSTLAGDERDARACASEPLPQHLSLYEAVSRALCNNPKVQHSWANVLMNADQVGVAQAAYLPTVNANASVQRARNTYTNLGQVQPDWTTRTSSQDASLSLSWVLFDFGQRSANLTYYRRLLDLAKASHTNSLQTIFEQTAEAFYNAWAGESALSAAVEAEATAEQSYRSAQRKHAAGVGTLNDELQARTAWQQATFDRINAAGLLRIAQGALCTAMGLAVDTPVAIDVDVGAQPTAQFSQSVGDLLEQAQNVNPKLRAARAQLDADKAGAARARSQALPTVSLTGNLDNDRQVAGYPGATPEKSRVIGIQISIPIFSGFGQVYRHQASEEQVNIDRADLRDAELQVATSVWQSYQTVTTRTESVNVARSEQQSAQQAYEVASRRYAVGIGALLDLLTAQSALANARRQIVQSQADWRIARLQLALAIGVLDGWQGTSGTEAP